MEVFKEEDYDGVAFIEYEDFELSKPSYLVIGLPDAGLVGGISVSHLIRELKAKEVGGVEIAKLSPPVAVIKDGAPRPPVRLFLARNDILLLASEIPLPPAAYFMLSYAILGYSSRRRIDYIVSITGLSTPSRAFSEKPKPYWAASGKKAVEAVEKLGAEKLSEGILVGPYAILLKEAFKFRLNNIVILVETFPDLPDPEAASVAVSLFGKLAQLEVDVSKLLEEAEWIRLRTRELMRQTSRVMSQMGKSLEAQPLLIYT